MNNQVKPVDADKVLEWLDTGGVVNFDELARTIFLKKVKQGEFAPDTPPVPTIKPGDTHDCPKCGEKNCFDTPLAESTALRFVWCSFCNQFSYKEDWR